MELTGVERKFRARLVKTGQPETTVTKVSPSSDADGDAHDKSPKNKLGYQKQGASYVNEHEGGGNDDQDSELRATVEGRIFRKDCGVGVV